MPILSVPILSNTQPHPLSVCVSVCPPVSLPFLVSPTPGSSPHSRLFLLRSQDPGSLRRLRCLPAPGSVPAGGPPSDQRPAQRARDPARR